MTMSAPGGISVRRRGRRAVTASTADQIGPRLGAHHERQGRLAIEEGGGVDVLHAVAHGRDVVEPDGTIVLVRDDQVPVVGGAFRLIVDQQLETLAMRIDDAFGRMRVGGGQRRAQVFEAHAVFEEGQWIHGHAHGGRRTAQELDIAHPRHLKQHGAQRDVHQIIQTRHRHHSGCDREDQHRRRIRIGAMIAGIETRCFRQIGPRRADSRLDVARGAVEIAPDLEAERDHGLAARGDRLHLRDAGDGAEMTLQRCGDRAGHGLRRAARIAGGDGNDRDTDIRQIGNGQRRQGQKTRQHGGDQKQRRRDRATDEKGDEGQRERPVPAGGLCL